MAVLCLGPSTQCSALAKPGGSGHVRCQRLALVSGWFHAIAAFNAWQAACFRMHDEVPHVDKGRVSLPIKFETAQVRGAIQLITSIRKHPGGCDQPSVLEPLSPGNSKSHGDTPRFGPQGGLIGI